MLLVYNILTGFLPSTTSCIVTAAAPLVQVYNPASELSTSGISNTSPPCSNLALDGRELPLASDHTTDVLQHTTQTRIIRRNNRSNTCYQCNNKHEYTIPPWEDTIQLRRVTFNNHRRVVWMNNCCMVVCEYKHTNTLAYNHCYSKSSLNYKRTMFVYEYNTTISCKVI